jgi:signal peptidase II
MNFYKNFKKKVFSKNTIIPILIVIFVFAFDRISKINILKYEFNNNRLFINDYLNLDLVWNTGISFGLFSQNVGIYYHGISFLIFSVIGFLIYLISTANLIDKTMFSLVLGGALGNFYDRFFYFAVPDFIDFHIRDSHWFTFNVADIFITIGIIMLIGKDLFLNKK